MLSSGSRPVGQHKLATRYLARLPRCTPAKGTISFLGRLLNPDSARLLRARIPERLMTAFADILHPATDVQQRSGILCVAGSYRFRADSLQGNEPEAARDREPVRPGTK